MKMGIIPVSELSEQRMEICRQCEFLKAQFCMKCGCLMAAKTKLNRASCPVGKWGSVGKKLPWEA
jgi:hypothetical protein